MIQDLQKIKTYVREVRSSAVKDVNHWHDLYVKNKMVNAPESKKRYLAAREIVDTIDEDILPTLNTCIHQCLEKGL